MLAEGLITGLIDGLMSVFDAGVDVRIQVQLGFVVLSRSALYAALRLALFRIFRQRSEASIHSKAQENSNFIETVRAVQSLEAAQPRERAESQWLNRYAEYVNANVRLGGRGCFKAINDTIYGLENVITIYLAAALALDNLITVGYDIAFVSYKLQFAERTALLIESWWTCAFSDCTWSVSPICAHPPRSGGRPGSVVCPTDPRLDRTAQRVLPLF